MSGVPTRQKAGRDVRFTFGLPDPRGFRDLCSQRLHRQGPGRRLAQAYDLAPQRKCFHARTLSLNRNVDRPTMRPVRLDKHGASLLVVIGVRLP